MLISNNKKFHNVRNVVTSSQKTTTLCPGSSSHEIETSTCTTTKVAFGGLNTTTRRATLGSRCYIGLFTKMRLWTSHQNKEFVGLAHYCSLSFHSHKWCHQGQGPNNYVLLSFAICYKQLLLYQHVFASFFGHIMDCEGLLCTHLWLFTDYLSLVCSMLCEWERPAMGGNKQLWLGTTIM